MDSLFLNILKAPVYGLAKRTPLEFAPLLSSRLSQKVYLKREDLQSVRSFKIRGAYNKICQLEPTALERGVIAASAGNHAQGVSSAAKVLGVKATIVMPQTTPSIKVEAVKSLGAEVILVGDHYSEAASYCAELSQKTGATLIHPFDDDLVIAGQGTIGKEIFEDCPDVTHVFVPIGGGGLAAGVSAYLKQVNPNIKVIGVQPKDSDAMYQSLKEGRRVEIENVGLFADGVAVKKVGKRNFELVRKYVDQIVRVDTDDIAAALCDLYKENRTILEPAGALGLAGLVRYCNEQGFDEDVDGARMVAINSGANMNFQRLQFVAERALTGSLSEALYAVRLEDRPGTLKSLCRTALKGKSLTEFNFRKSGHGYGQIFLGVGIDGLSDKDSFERTLLEHSYQFTDLTYNELAKVHLRHLMGGRYLEGGGEKIIQFAFPERQGAIAEFLDLMSSNWNISLFHYRSHGSDFGRVLIGFEVPSDEGQDFQGFLEKVGFSYTDESENPAYSLFL